MFDYPAACGLCNRNHIRISGAYSLSYPSSDLKSPLNDHVINCYHLFIAQSSKSLNESINHLPDAISGTKGGGAIRGKRIGNVCT